MTDPALTVLSATCALLVAFVAGRASRHTAGEGRLWSQRSEVYVELLAWLNEDLRLMRHGEPMDRPARREMTARLQAFGQEPVDSQLDRYERARHLGDFPLADSHGQSLRMAIRNALRPLPSRMEPILGWALGARPLSRVFAAARAKVQARRWYADVPQSG